MGLTEVSGDGLTRTARSVGLVANFALAQLTALVRSLGGYLLMPKPGYIFEDAAGTTPASQDGLVGRINCSAGSGNYASQNTTNLKPRYRIGDVNRLLDSATLSTQNVATYEIPYTLHFTGTGTVTLSGTSTAGPLVGTGVSDRVSLTFTPTAGALTLTVSGSVTAAMLNTGSTVAPYVATTSAPKSNGIGPAWVETDGVDDYMLTSIATPASGHIFMGGRQYSYTTSAWSGSGTYNKIGINTVVLTDKRVQHQSHNGTSGGSATLPAPTVTAGTASVLESEWNPTYQAVRLNGVEATNNQSINPAASSQFLLFARNGGDWPTVTPQTFTAGGFTSIIIVPTTLTNSEKQVLRRYVAQLEGVTI